MLLLLISTVICGPPNCNFLVLRCIFDRLVVGTIRVLRAFDMTLTLRIIMRIVRVSRDADAVSGLYQRVVHMGSNVKAFSTASRCSGNLLASSGTHAHPAEHDSWTPASANLEKRMTPVVADDLYPCKSSFKWRSAYTSKCCCCGAAWVVAIQALPCLHGRACTPSSLQCQVLPLVCHVMCLYLRTGMRSSLRA